MLLYITYQWVRLIFDIYISVGISCFLIFISIIRVESGVCTPRPLAHSVLKVAGDLFEHRLHSNAWFISPLGLTDRTFPSSEAAVLCELLRRWPISFYLSPYWFQAAVEALA